jgi:hypothetical protein
VPALRAAHHHTRDGSIHATGQAEQRHPAQRAHDETTRSRLAGFFATVSLVDDTPDDGAFLALLPAYLPGIGMQPHHSLSTYLNDHLAGSVVAIRLMESLEETFGENVRTRSMADDVRQLRREVEADRDVLEQLIAHVGTSESTLRKTAGWFAERFTMAKMQADDSIDGTFRVLESTEVIALGMLGKRGLWRALQAASDLVPVTQELDFDTLLARADAQYERMELLRLGAARAALGSRTE